MGKGGPTHRSDLVSKDPNPATPASRTNRVRSQLIRSRRLIPAKNGSSNLNIPSTPPLRTVTRRRAASIPIPRFASRRGRRAGGASHRDLVTRPPFLFPRPLPAFLFFAGGGPVVLENMIPQLAFISRRGRRPISPSSITLMLRRHRAHVKNAFPLPFHQILQRLLVK